MKDLAAQSSATSSGSSSPPREGVTQQFADGVYWNKAQQPQSYLYDPDLSRPASTNDYSKDYSARVTWQASQKNKLAFSRLVPVELQLRVQPAHGRPDDAGSGG